MWVDIIQSIESLNRTTRQEKGKFTLYLTLDIHLLLPLYTGIPSSWAFIDSDWNLHHPSPKCQAFGLRLNYTMTFPGSPACSGRSWDFLASLITLANSCKSPLTYIYVYIHVIDSVPLKNPV